MKRIGSFAFLLCAVTRAFGAVPSFTPLGDLPGGYGYSRPEAVANGGAVVVGASDVSVGGMALEGFRWTRSDGMKSVAEPGKFVGNVTDVTADGQIFAGWVDLGNQSVPFYSTPTANFQLPLGAPNDPISISGDTFLSADGKAIATSFYDGTGRQAVRWTEAEGPVVPGRLFWRCR